MCRRTPEQREPEAAGAAGALGALCDADYQQEAMLDVEPKEQAEPRAPQPEPPAAPPET